MLFDFYVLLWYVIVLYLRLSVSSFMLDYFVSSYCFRYDKNLPTHDCTRKRIYEQTNLGESEIYEI